MRYAISVPPGGRAHDLVACALAAERTGWDGFFLWDHIYVADGMPLHDPWVVLGAVAAATGRVRLGALVTPVARRRPWKLAKEIITVDHLSGGRVVVGAGLGIPDSEFTAFGETADPRARAAALDEGLVLLDGFLRGDEVVHDGALYHVRARLTPGSVQRPRPPIWVAATWPHRRPLRRAARYDGVFALGLGAAGGLPPEHLAEIRQLLGPDADIVVPYDSPASPRELADAGATWYVVSPPEPGEDWLAQFTRRVEQGPPS